MAISVSGDGDELGVSFNRSDIFVLEIATEISLLNGYCMTTVPTNEVLKDGKLF